MAQSNNNAEHYSNPHCEESLKKWREWAKDPNRKSLAGSITYDPNRYSAIVDYLNYKIHGTELSDEFYEDLLEKHLYRNRK